MHCLMVGDPGLGKSQLLKAVSSIAPRSVYVCGNTATASGLTVTIVKDGSTSSGLEAGTFLRIRVCIQSYFQSNSRTPQEHWYSQIKACAVLMSSTRWDNRTMHFSKSWNSNASPSPRLVLCVT